MGNRWRIRSEFRSCGVGGTPADDSRGWLEGTRLELPAGAGELLLPSGERAIAEPGCASWPHGILPAAISHGGLSAGIEVLVFRVRMPASVEVTAERLPAPLETAGYFVVAEALTNVVKHAHR